MKGKITMSSAELDEYTMSISVNSVYLLDAISTWSSEFGSRIISEQQFITQLCIIMTLIIILLHLLIF